LAENRIFSYFLYSTPQLGNIAVPYGMVKLKCCGYPMVKKSLRTCFDRIPGCDYVTDRQTSCYSIVLLCVASRG